MAQSNATKEIIRQLSYGPRTSYALSVASGLTQPSVRATIGRLRATGLVIETIGTGLDAQYVLQGPFTAAAPVAQGDGDQGDAFDTDIDAGDVDDFGNQRSGN